MENNICPVCGKDYSDLSEEGCEDCAVDYDPLQPEYNEELNFDAPVSSEYEPNSPESGLILAEYYDESEE